jgi:hypothetical protein
MSLPIECHVLKLVELFEPAPEIKSRAGNRYDAESAACKAHRRQATGGTDCAAAQNITTL